MTRLTVPSLFYLPRSERGGVSARLLLLDDWLERNVE